MSILGEKIVSCKQCPRLISHCQNISRKKRKSFSDWEYWGRPVPNFGEENSAELLIVGLAPGAHGANRTGRMFTGDRSGDWLYRALYKFGFSTQAESTDANDGLILKRTLITAVVHCAPPDNKPTREEILACQPYLQETMKRTKAKVYLALGHLAWRALNTEFKVLGLWNGACPRFHHLSWYKIKSGEDVIGSYHPSQQNTFTGRLTEDMFHRVFLKIKKILQKKTNK